MPGAEAVSSVMRTKDRPVLLPRGINSVVSQSFTDWRLYIVNDGGDPSTVEAILDQHRDKFGDRITIIHNQMSSGMEAASNCALRMAQGQYYIIHDDDDSWHPDFLARTVTYLSDPSNAGFIGVVTNCDAVIERIEGNVVVQDSVEPWSDYQLPIDLAQMIVKNRFPPISFLVRRSILLQIGIYNEALPVSGDWEFNIRALMLATLELLGTGWPIIITVGALQVRHTTTQSPRGLTDTDTTMCSSAIASCASRCTMSLLCSARCSQ